MTKPQEKQKVRDFIEMNGKPFTSKQCSMSTGVCIESVRFYLRNFRKAGVVEVIANQGRTKIYNKIRDEKVIRKIKLKSAMQFMNENREYCKLKMCM